MDSFDVLVIILSATLAILLVLLIIATTYVIKILRHVRNITEKAESVADRVDNVSSYFEKGAAPVALGQMLANFTGAFSKGKNKKGRERDYDDE